MAEILKIHDVARIRSGKYAGLVGTVTQTRTDDAGKQTSVRVEIEGVNDGEAFKVQRSFKRSEVEHHGA
jgi:endo-1,4-beta-mannosidase